METRANYALIGVFTLSVIAAAFGFVLWFSGSEKPGGRTTYKIIFNGSVRDCRKAGRFSLTGSRLARSPRSIGCRKTRPGSMR